MMTKIKLILLVVAIAAGMTEGMAQTTIGADIAPIEGAILDLKQQEPTSANVTANKGMVLPRVALAGKTTLLPLAANTTENRRTHVGTAVYNLTNTDGNASNGPLRIGLNLWDGEQWVLVGGPDGLRYFYMPPFNLELGGEGEVRTINLYTEYIKRFTHANTSPLTANPQFMTSEGSSYILPGLYGRYDLYYVVLDHSGHVNITAMNNDGSMSYAAVIASHTNPEEAYLNIILVIK